jgi:hypothetical protein
MGEEHHGEHRGEQRVLDCRLRRRAQRHDPEQPRRHEQHNDGRCRHDGDDDEPLQLVQLAGGTADAHE